VGIHEHLRQTAALLEDSVSAIGEAAVDDAVAAMVGALARDRPLLICGNGGSAADAMHITGELVGRYLMERKALRAICLADNPAVLTAWSNDYAFDTVFARQVEAYGEAGAVLLGISTSGNSENVVRAFEAGRAMGMITMALTGEGGGRLAPLADHLLAVPSTSTPMIQQVHICLYHYMCEQIEVGLAG
jgi:D-sedoheptulose 7-phosphate isomerase